LESAIQKPQLKIQPKTTTMLRRLRGPARTVKKMLEANQAMPAHTMSFTEEVEVLERMPEGELSAYDWSVDEETKPRRPYISKK
jgi:hypothetical protein